MTLMQQSAVSYEWNNGFVEGTNNRVKMVKRTMFGRCSRRLLEAKMLPYPLCYCYVRKNPKLLEIAKGSEV